MNFLTPLLIKGNYKLKDSAGQIKKMLPGKIPLVQLRAATLNPEELNNHNRNLVLIPQFCSAGQLEPFAHIQNLRLMEWTGSVLSRDQRTTN